MSNEQSRWLDLIWRALAENDSARKAVLLKQAHSLLERQARDPKTLPGAA